MEDNKELKEKKKQKPGLNAVRPSDFVEAEFKKMAKDGGITQTEMFNHIFWSYINDQENERKEKALSLEPEVNLISKNLSNILDVIKTIVDKSQNSILSIKSNAEQTEKNLNTDIDTIRKKLEEAAKRNEELENFNKTFQELKNGLDSKIVILTESLKDAEGKLKASSESNKALQKELDKSNKEVNRLSTELENNNNRLNRIEEELKNSKELNKDNTKTIKDLEKQVAHNEKINSEFENEVFRLKQEINSKDASAKGFEQANLNLTSIINTLDQVKKSEIDAIKAKDENEISELKTKINQIENNLKVKYEAEKMNSIASIKLELAEMTGKYTETLAELNSFKLNNKKK